MKKHNFSAGPSILPRQVFEQAAAGVLDLSGSGLSILEISHRSNAFEEILDSTKQLVRSLLKLSDSYHVLFLSGGASSQFFMVPMNLLNPPETACYIDSGAWSLKAIKEAGHFGKISVLASSKDRQYAYIPKKYTVPDMATYLHITSNNTISGTQYHQWPESKPVLVADMSSDIFSRPLDIKPFGLIYAGAQKNMGPAGTTLVIIRDDLLGRVSREIPTMLNYQTHVSKNSMFNTPPVFPIYVTMLNLQWLHKQGGLEAAGRRNQEKARIIYDEVDRNSMFLGLADAEDRSLMNATFVLKDSALESDFLEACSAAGCEGVKGHRSIGGIRASIYNAMGKESVSVLADVMKEFEQKFG
ncbi:MAG: 3-phosphoserine/phosphohydroxythreonine transaminase [Saprospiraceae bacterium]|nr:3-phosphoserine/phosphohydroxythreonine transaminase [Saprospiraceae bacterium]